MAIIKVKVGGCGVRYLDAHGNARHALKTPESGPFECDDAQAERLVGLRVAEYVGPQCAFSPVEQQGKTGEAEKAAGRLDVKELEGMEYNELKKLAAEMGVKPEGKTKADYIKALAAAEIESDEDDDALPELSAADPE